MSINVDFDQKSGRFVIHAPFWALGMMRSIPNRKFEKRLNNAWTAPALKANVKYLSESLPSNAVITPAAKVKMQDVLEPMVPPDLPWPNDYVFKTEPFPHQQLALNACYAKKAFALFMDMRTGKTKVTIDEAMALFYARKIDRLVVIPLKTLRRNWGREFSIHADKGSYDLHYLESGEPKQYSAWEQKSDGRLKVLMVGIESLSAGKAIDMVLHFLHGDRCMVAVDESDTIKNHKAIRTENMYKIRDKAEYRLILTGTPISKGPMDFFAQFEFLDPNIFGIGDFYSFRNRYAIMGGYEDKEIVGYQNMDELTELAKPFVYQVKYTDVFKSPPAVYEVRTCELSPEQREKYARLKKDNTIRDDKNNIKLVAQNILEKMLRLQEICGGHWSERHETGKFAIDPITQIKKPKYRYEHHDIPGKRPKLELVEDIVMRDFKGEQGIIWCIYLPEIRDIYRHLTGLGISTLVLHGDVDESDRDALDKSFRAGATQWIIANPTTGGRGYTFDAATVMINYSYSHSYIHRKQSLERATSSKKTKPVVIIDLVAEKTVDEVVLESLENKEDLADFVKNRLSQRAAIDEIVF